MSRRLTRHTPLLLLAAAILSMVSCQHDEPPVHRPGEHDSIVTPIDTVHPADTTTHQPNDTTTPPPSDSTGAVTLLLSAPRDYGYMGQTLQLTVETSDSATITWKSSNTLAATVDDQGLVSIASLSADAQTTITATAMGVTDSLTLRCLPSFRFLQPHTLF